MLFCADVFAAELTISKVTAGSAKERFDFQHNYSLPPTIMPSAV
jgi:hypothetical protein